MATKVKTSRKEFILWIRKIPDFPVWIKLTSSTSSKTLQKERMFRFENGYETSVLPFGVHPDSEVKADFDFKKPDKSIETQDYRILFYGGNVVISSRSDFYKNIQIHITFQEWIDLLAITKPHSGYSSEEITATHFWLTK